GNFLCAHCSILRLDCMYRASYRRGRVPSIEIEMDDVGEQAARATEEQLKGSAPARDEDEDHIPSLVSIEARAFEPYKPTSGRPPVQSVHNTPEPAPIDRQGH